MQGDEAFIIRASEVETLQRLRRLFHEGFTAGEVADPLASFPAAAPADAVRGQAQNGAHRVVSLWHEGRLVGLVPTEGLGAGLASDHMIPIDRVPTVPHTLPLHRVARLLGEYPFLAVAAFGTIAGIITTGYLGRPATRMWLFGLVSLIEMALRQTITRHMPAGEWRRLLSPARLEKAQRLHGFRRAAGEQVDLLDCLQLSDISNIMMKDPTLRGLTAHESRRAGQEQFRRLEQLRDLLAHSQAIGPELQPLVSGLAERLDTILHFAATSPQPQTTRG